MKTIRRVVRSAPVATPSPSEVKTVTQATPRIIRRALPAQTAPETPAATPQIRTVRRATRAPATPPPPPVVEAPSASITTFERPADRVDYIAIIARYHERINNRASAIRAKCIECSGGSLSEVRECVIKRCALYPFRLGEDPFNAKTAKNKAAKQSLNTGEEE